MRKYLFLIPIILFYAGCKNKINNTEKIISASKNYDFELVQKEILKFPFDSVSGFDLTSLQVFKNDTNKYLMYFNSDMNIIYFYDFYQQNLGFSINLEEEGTDGVGSDINGIFVQSLDSIYVVTDYVLSRINTEGKVLERLQFDRMPNSDFGYLLEAGTKTMVHKYDNNLYLGISSELDPFLLESFKVKDQAILRIDLKNKSATTHFDFPDKYSEILYSPNYSNIYFTFNEKTKLFALSFPADPNIYLNSLDNFKGSVDAGSMYFNQIDPMKNDDMKEDFMTYTKHYLTNFSYGPIYYDKYKNLYYRFVEHALSETDFENQNWNKTCSIIILDSEFNVIGETKFDNTVNKLGIIDDSGLLIPVKCSEDNEDYFCVAVYRMERKVN